jgi:hypothetical protein
MICIAEIATISLERRNIYRIFFSDKPLNSANVKEMKHPRPTPYCALVGLSVIGRAISIETNE